MQKKKTFTIPAALAALALFAAAPARCGAELTLAEAVAENIARSYDLKSRDAQLAQAEAGARQTRNLPAGT